MDICPLEKPGKVIGVLEWGERASLLFPETAMATCEQGD